MDSPRARLLAALQYARSTIDLARLSYALHSGDATMAVSAVDAGALRAGLLRRFSPARGHALADETLRAWGALVASLAHSPAATWLQPADVAKLFGLNLGQVPVLVQTAAGAARNQVPPSRARALVARRGSELLAARADHMAEELGTPDLSHATLASAAKGFEGELKDAYLEVVAAGQEAMDLSAVSGAIASGNLHSLISLLPIAAISSGFAAMGQSLSGVFGISASLTLAHLMGVSDPLPPRELDSQVEAWVTTRSRALEDWARSSLEYAAMTALRGEAQDLGIPPDLAAQGIADRIGLGQKWIDAAVKIEATALKDGEDVATAAGLASDYTLKTLSARVDSFASNQPYAAAMAGQSNAWLQAQRAGAVSATATKTFLTEDDGSVCPTCSGADGETVPIDEPFSVGDPGDVHEECRCYQVMNDG